jgi:SAM-dependent methyltransferase
MKLETEADVKEWTYAAKALAVVSAWQAVGAFERLRAGPSAPGELGMAARALATTLPVVLHLGLVASDGETIGLTETGRRLLESGRLPGENNLEMLFDLAQMRTLLESGGPARDRDGTSKATRGGVVDDPVRMARFLDMLYGLSGSAAEDVFVWLSRKLPAGGSILDLGGGHGRYARRFADGGYPATLLDLPHVVEYARGKHGDALSYVAGDFHTLEDLGGPYDLVFLSNIAHGESYEENASLVARAARSLKPGGRIAVKDMYLDELGKGPANAVFFGLTMLTHTEHGQSPSFRALFEWFARAGLERDGVIALETQAIACGRKPTNT